MQGKWTKISAKGKGQTAVQEVREPEKSLAQYLALPVEEYSLLDPSWITRSVSPSRSYTIPGGYAQGHDSFVRHKTICMKCDFAVACERDVACLAAKT